jgi:hypothetical protein
VNDSSLQKEEDNVDDLIIIILDSRWRTGSAAKSFGRHRAMRDQDCNPIVSLTTNASDLTPQDMREGYLEMMPDDNSYKEI